MDKGDDDYDDGDDDDDDDGDATMYLLSTVVVRKSICIMIWT